MYQLSLFISFFLFSGANLNSIGYGIATPFGSDWKDLINLAILALQEKGELKKLEIKWWVELTDCVKDTSAVCQKLFLFLF